MVRLILSRLRSVAPDTGKLFGSLVIFLLFEGFIWYLESKNIPIGARLPFRPSAVFLFGASINHGISRVIGFHPIWQTDYRIWLESAPWTNRKPLPLGPVELRWEDGLILGPIILLSAILPEPRAMQLLDAFLLSHLLMLVVTLWLTEGIGRSVISRPWGWAWPSGSGTSRSPVCWSRPWCT